MDLKSGSGSKIYIGTTTAADTEALFEADTYALIGVVETRGEYGDEAQEITFTALEDGRVRKSKGARDSGSLAITCGRDPDDAGQTALIAAEATSDAYNFKIERDDQITPTTGNPTTEYVRAFVLSAKRGEASSNAIETLTFNLSLDSAIITTDAV